MQASTIQKNISDHTRVKIRQKIVREMKVPNVLCDLHWSQAQTLLTDK